MLLTEEKQKDIEFAELLKKQVVFLHSDVTLKNITPKQYVESMYRIENQIIELEKKYGVKPPKTINEKLKEIHESLQRMGQVLEEMLKQYEVPMEEMFEEEENEISEL